MSDRTVTIEVNQQQEQMLDRLIAEGGLGSSYGEVVRSGFLRFCKAHPDLAGRPGAVGDEEAEDG